MIKLLENFNKIVTCIFKPCINCFYKIFFCLSKYKCEICNCRFKHKQYLALHIRTYHPEIFVWGSSKNFKNILESEKLI